MLYISRLKSLATEVYKILNGYSPVYLEDLLQVKDNIYNMRSKTRLVQQKCNTVTFGLQTFSYKGSKIWNELPASFKNVISLKDFKKIIKTWNGPNCLCTMCCSLQALLYN